MSAAAIGFIVLTAGLLTLAAVLKAVHPDPARQALISLGVPSRAATIGLYGAIVFEALVAAALVVWPSAPMTQAACLVLFAGFATIGVLALRSRRALECGCFGPFHRATLGWPQLLSLAVVAVALVLLGRHMPSWEVPTALAVLTVVQAVVSAVLLAHLVPAWWQLRRDQRSLTAVKEYVEAFRAAKVGMASGNAQSG